MIYLILNKENSLSANVSIKPTANLKIIQVFLKTKIIPIENRVRCKDEVLCANKGPQISQKGMNIVQMNFIYHFMNSFYRKNQDICKKYHKH